MPNSAPYEVIAAPFDLYVAPVGSVFPAHDATPDSNIWTKVGTSLSLNYDRGEGVTVEHRQTVVPWRSAGDTGSRKVFRTEEDLVVRMRLVDITLEQYTHALNYNTVTSEQGFKKIGLSRGTQIITKALLIRGGVSPYQEEGNCQYEIPLAQQSGSPSVALSKPGEPAALDLEWMALVDTTAASADERFGRLIAADDTATT